MGAEAIIEKIRKNAAEEAASLRKQGEERAAAAEKQIIDAASAEAEGFCSPKTLEILSRELHLDPAQITKEGTGSEILVGKNKDTTPGEGGTWKRTQEPGGKEALHE